MPRQIKKSTIRMEDGTTAILSTAELFPGEYETMLATPDYGTEYRVLHARTEAQALKHFRYLRDNYHRPPLTGKYLKLSEDLRKAAEVGGSVARATDDGGTCNFDAATLYLPGWIGSKVEQAAKAAGVGCSEWTLWGSRSFVFSLRGAGQGNANTAGAEAMSKALADMGYDAGMYYQMD